MRKHKQKLIELNTFSVASHESHDISYLMLNITVGRPNCYEIEFIEISLVSAFKYLKNNLRYELVQQLHFHECSLSNIQVISTYEL